MDDKIYKNLLKINKEESVENFNKIFNTIENKYKINKSLIIKNYITYVLNNKLELLNNELINEIEYIIHNLENEELATNYIFYSLKDI
tara:strand:- start:334 stop:597 length:264 start_codon:yes stop_codon:yes gene_type:complete